MHRKLTLSSISLVRTRWRQTRNTLVTRGMSAEIDEHIANSSFLSLFFSLSFSLSLSLAISLNPSLSFCLVFLSSPSFPRPLTCLSLSLSALIFSLSDSLSFLLSFAMCLSPSILSLSVSLSLHPSLCQHRSVSVGPIVCLFFYLYVSLFLLICRSFSLSQSLFFSVPLSLLENN